MATGNSGRWTPLEDARLREGVERFGACSWKQISEECMMSSRSDVQCLHRWQKVLRPGLVKGPWTVEEDAIILHARALGILKWSEVANLVP